MRRFACPTCDTPIYFDNLGCLHCGAELWYELDADDFVPPSERACANRTGPERCNWVAETGSMWCRSCALDTDHGATPLRRPFQEAKRRALRQLRIVGVDLTVDPRLKFELVEGTADQPVTIGHADGLITLDAAEGDPAELASVRTSLGEPYRTPLGHVRHELGHWYWTSRRDVTFSTDSFRDHFGDERGDYTSALESHYARRDDGGWRSSHISFYAAAHPWEDFAETFAHCLHVLDALETAHAHGIDVGHPVHETLRDFDHVYRSWVDLTFVLNELNRSMGTPDPYPFAVGPDAVDKLRFMIEALATRR